MVSVLNNDDMVEKVLLCIRDMTEVKKLEESAAATARDGYHRPAAGYRRK